MSNPLPSWADGAVRIRIVDFIARITREESVDFVPPAERIAVFDHDGTLWCEQPLQVQVFFAFDRLRQIVDRDQSMRERQPFKAFLERDKAAIACLGKKGAFDVAMTTHAGMTDREFAAITRTWLASARNPSLGTLFTQCVYRPQIELIDYLHANSFKVFIVSAGGADFMRTICEQAYGIPTERVIGSSLKTQFDAARDGAALTRLAEVNSFNDRNAKVQNIGLHIGRRPILAFGNSDGDLAMLRYTLAGEGARLSLLLHHDDAEREFAYDRDFKMSPLSDALDNADDYGLTVVSMQRSWKGVFAGEAQRRREIFRHAS
jgi:phosphoserine phosphatase